VAALYAGRNPSGSCLNSMYGLISIHDVMPDNLARVHSFLQQLSRFPSRDICLLVVPGCRWQSGQIDQLRTWQEQGYELAGHGWRHQAGHISGVYHRLHSQLLSRDVAEHLCLSTQQIALLIQRSYDWFIANDLKPPVLYVPPAWALGNIGHEDLEALPYQYYETLSGFLDVSNHQHCRCPLIGFEARSRWQGVLLSLFNQINIVSARAYRPTRISLHPHDREYYLGHMIDSVLSSVQRTFNYQQCLNALSIDRIDSTGADYSNQLNSLN